MKTWVAALIAALAALVVVAGVGGYFLGMNAGKASANAIRSRFMAARGLNGQGGYGAANGTPGAGAGAGWAGANGAPVTIGTVKSIDNGTIVVTTRNGDVKVQVGSNATVQEMARGSVQDIKPGERITVAGQADGSGVVTANSIQVLPAANPGASLTPSS